MSQAEFALGMGRIRRKIRKIRNKGRLKKRLKGAGNYVKGELMSGATQAVGLGAVGYGLKKAGMPSPFSSAISNRAEFRKRLSRSHRKKISRSLRGKRRGSRGTNTDRLAGAERASKLVRNLSLAAETPSKIGRNLAYSSRAISSTSRGLDRGLNRAYTATRILRGFR